MNLYLSAFVYESMSMTVCTRVCVGGAIVECVLLIYVYLHVSVFVGDCVWVYGVS